MSRSEHIEFFSGPGFRLKGVFYGPEKHEKACAVVVLCNGYMGLKEIYMPQAAAELSAAGYASLAFDYRGFGESEGPPYRLLPNEQIEDIHNAISYVESRPDVDSSRIGLWGTSLGGAHALTVAATDPRARCTVANMPGMYFREHMHRRTVGKVALFAKELAVDRVERVKTGTSRRVVPLEIMPYDDESRNAYESSLARFPLRRQMLFPLETADRLAEYMPERFVDLIAPRPLLIISAELDKLTPAVEQKQLFERAGFPKRLEVIKGATHYSAYTSPFFERILDLSVGFYKDAL